MSEYLMSFAATVGDAEELLDGTKVIRRAVITAPKRWAGQVRDVTLWPDGSVTLGADQRRRRRKRAA